MHPLPEPAEWPDDLPLSLAASPHWTMAAFNAVNELFLPALKAAIARPAQVDRDEDGWELTPPAEDSTLSLPRTLAHETTVGRLCELGPKVWLLCVHCAVLVGSCFSIVE